MTTKEPKDMDKTELATELHGYNPAVSVDDYKRMTEDALRSEVIFKRGGGVTPPPPVTTPEPPVVTPPATPDPPALVEVPRVLKLTVEQARDKILDAELLFDPAKVNQQNDPYAKRMEVILQRPTAGEMVPQGTTMELTVSIPETPPKKPKIRTPRTSWVKALIFPADFHKKIDEIKD